MQTAYTFSLPLTRHQNVLRSSCQCSTSSGPSRPTIPVCRSRKTDVFVVQAVVADQAASKGKKEKWNYKYKRMPCPSPCQKGETLCCQVEALVQNVLSFPNLPVQIYRALPRLQANINGMTALVESMASHFGKELTLCYLRAQPKLLELDFAAVLERCEALKKNLNIRDSDLPQLLRKCPHLLTMHPQEVKQNYEHIPRVIQFTPLQVRQLVLKYPRVLATSPQRLQISVDRLRKLCYTRDEWARDFESITPSLLAFFLRDASDQIIRLEYLASTGERPEWQLREVMKPANRSFRSKLRNFAQYEQMVKQKRAQQRAAAAAAAAQAEAAAVKAALLAADADSSTSSDIENSSSSSSSVTQQ